MNFLTKFSGPAAGVALLLASSVQAQEHVPVSGTHVDDPRTTEGASDIVESQAAATSDVVGACVASHEDAQLARLNGGFLEALNHLARCSEAACPEAVREDCVDWTNELKSLTPSVLIVVRGASGDMENAKVFVDGYLVREQLDGRRVALDPGKHLIRVEGESGQVQERSVVLAEGEGTRRLVFEFQNGPSLPAETAPASLIETARPVPPLTYVLGGTALVSLGLGAVLGINAVKRSKQAGDACAPLCDPDVSRAVTERAIAADIALGVSVLSIAGAVLAYAYRPEVAVAEDGISLDLRAGHDGGHLLLGGQF